MRHANVWNSLPGRELQNPALRGAHGMGWSNRKEVGGGGDRGTDHAGLMGHVLAWLSEEGEKSLGSEIWSVLGSFSKVYIYSTQA